jgi:hypothetical protein
MSEHPFVWVPGADPEAWLTHAYFRRELKLRTTPRRAEIHLFANTIYHLKVNGAFVGYGPARAYPECPEYDTYDLAPFLRRGDNAIAVEVSHHGVTTFHHLLRPGCLVAWGEIRDGARRISLATGEGWRCRKSDAHEPFPPRFSFAIGPIQIFDERRAPAGWDRPGAPDAGWTEPVRIDASAWGALRPRSIPHLTQETCLAERLLGAWRHADDEHWLGFRQRERCNAGDERPPGQYVLACTFVHSPRAQDVEASVWWGEWWLNGAECERIPDRPDRPFRQLRRFVLREGWNFLLMGYGTTMGLWEMMLAVPREAGLAFSADRETEGEAAFRVSPPLTKEEAAAIQPRLPVDGPDALPELAGRWEERRPEPFPVSPCRGLAWARFGERLALPAHAVADLQLPAADCSLVFDLGRMTLGRVFVEFDAPPGACVDVGYAEELQGDRPRHYKMVLVQSGERHIARGGPARLETFAPRGFRYLQVGVRGASRPVTIRRAGAVSQVYPYALEGAFECSDPCFNTLWEYGWETLRLCSEDVITDTPWRERTLYGGDLLVEAGTTFVGSRDRRLVKRCIEIFLQSKGDETPWLQSRAPLPRDRPSLSDYPLLVLILAEWYGRLTGDDAFARRAAEPYGDLMRGVLAETSRGGLVAPAYRMFVNHGYPVGQGRLAAYNALVSGSLRAWARLLKRAGGRSAEATASLAAAAKLDRWIAKELWDEEASAFMDVRPEDSQHRGRGIQANAWTLLFTDLAGRKRDLALRRIASELGRFEPLREAETVSPYTMFYLLGALYRHGSAGLAENAMRTVYQWMMERKTGTVWEHSDPEKSLSHAWSTAPNYYLSTRALGVRMGFPETDNLGEVLIAPESETLDWARGAVPHPRGLVRVSWTVRGGELFLDYSAPRGARVRVEPRGRLAALRLRVNGRRVSRSTYCRSDGARLRAR